MATRYDEAMATPRPAPRKPIPTYNREDPAHLTVDPRWLMKVFGLTILAAFVCAYLAMCFLFWQGSWQLVLHPTHNAQATTGLPTEIVHFGPNASGQPQLTGEFYRAGRDSGTQATVLYLRPGDGQLDSHDAPLMTMLHDLGLNVFVFDYRGYGRSAQKPHPTEEHLQQDAASAWQYLTGLRAVSPDHVVVYGAGVGASVATQLAAAHPNAATLVLRNAAADVTGAVRREPRSRVFPIALLFHDSFKLDGLNQLSTPKLLLDIGPNDLGPEDRARQAIYRAAHDPKTTVELPNDDPAQESKAVHRFLDERAGLLPPAVLMPQLPAPK